MSQQVEAVTTAALSLALDAASLRHQAIAANIANHATEGYVPMKLDFEAHLAQARVGQAGQLDASALAAMQLRLEPALDAHGAPATVELDAEMADMARNAVHFQALARGLNRHFAILAMAASEGKK